MRKKVSLAVAGLLAGGMISVGTGSPAYAQDGCTAQDPVLAYVCSLIPDDVPDPQAWVTHYYNMAGAAVKRAYCTLWEDPSCP